MEVALITIGTIFLLSLIYLNVVATILIFKEPGTKGIVRVLKCIFIWLIPVIGFSFTLRFSQQVFECELHYKLVPRFVANWIYDDSFPNPNKNRDENDLKAICYGLFFYR